MHLFDLARADSATAAHRSPRRSSQERVRPVVQRILDSMPGANGGGPGRSRSLDRRRLPKGLTSSSSSALDEIQGELLERMVKKGVVEVAGRWLASEGVLLTAVAIPGGPVVLAATGFVLAVWSFIELLDSLQSPAEDEPSAHEPETAAIVAGVKAFLAKDAGRSSEADPDKPPAYTPNFPIDMPRTQLPPWLGR